MTRPPTRRWAEGFGRALPAIVVASVLAGQLATVHAGHDWGGDFALYLAHARNLAVGTPYADTGYLYSVRNPFVSPPTYPPGFPLLLTPVWAWAGTDFAALKTVTIVAFAAAVAIGPLALRGHLSRDERVAWMLLVGANPYLWQFRQSILSDLPFLLCVLGAMAVVGGPGQPRRRPPWQAVACGVLMGCAVALRTVGVALPAALVATALVGRGPDRRFTVLACAVAGASLCLQNSLVHRDAAYFDQLLPFIAKPGAMVALTAGKISGWSGGWIAMWSGMAGAGVSGAVAVSVLVLAGIGLVYQVRVRGASIGEFFALIYGAVILAWPMGHDPRFLIPLMPLLIAYMLIGLRALVSRSHPPPRRAWWRRGVAAVLALHVASGTALSPALPPGRDVTGPEASAWFTHLRDHTRETDVLIAAKPRVVALMTGRRCAALVGPDAFADHVSETGATHLVLAGLPEEWLAKVEITIRHQGKPWQRTYLDGRFAVYRIPPRADEPRSGPVGTDG